MVWHFFGASSPSTLSEEKEETIASQKFARLLNLRRASNALSLAGYDDDDGSHHPHYSPLHLVIIIIHVFSSFQAGNLNKKYIHRFPKRCDHFEKMTIAIFDIDHHLCVPSKITASEP